MNWGWLILPAPAAADGDALVHEHRGGELPAGVQFADLPVLRDADVGEEHLVEVRPAVDLVDRADLDAGRLHVHDEHRQAGVLHLVGVGAGDDDAVVGDVGEGGPHLLTVEHPLVTVELGLGLQAGDVGAGARLGEHLTPHRAAGDVVGEELALLLRRAVLVEHRQAHAVADDELAVHHRVVALDLAPDLLVGERQAATAVFGGERNAGETGVCGGGEVRPLLVDRRSAGALGVGLHEVDALLTERIRLALGQAGRGARRRDGVGHVLAPSSGIGRSPTHLFRFDRCTTVCLPTV